MIIYIFMLKFEISDILNFKTILLFYNIYSKGMFYREYINI